MHKRLLLLLSFLILSCASKEELFNLVDQDTSCHIVLDLGSYSSVQEASDAHSEIDWFNAEHQQDDICRTALAALELQHYLSLIVGIPASQIPIVDDDAIPPAGNLIFIGAPKNTGFKKSYRPIKRQWRKSKSDTEQDFRIDSFNSKEHKGLILSGSSSVSTLYAVYELLTRWGVRWYAPEAHGEYVPQFAKISVYKMHEYVDPSFKVRGYWIDSKRQENLADSLLIPWLGRNRLNLFRHKEDQIGALKQRGILLNTGRQDLFSTLIKPDYQYRYNHPIFRGDDQYPIDPYISSEYYKGDLDKDNKLTNAEAHPEWFGIEADTSDHKNVDPNYSHMCLSHPDAAKEFAQTIVDKLQYGDWKTCDIIDLWTPELWCMCDKCQDMGNGADKLLYLMYHVNKAVQNSLKEGALTRPIYVHGYARKSALDQPTEKLPDDFVADNTAIFLFTGARCYNHFIIDPECSDINVWFSKILLAWLGAGDIYSGDINIAENYNADYYNDLPTVHSNMMNIDIAVYAEMGLRGLNFQHPRTRDIGVQTLTNYQFARQSWDARVAVDTLKQDFFAHHYVGAVNNVQKYYERLELAMGTITTWRYYLPHHWDSALNTTESNSPDGMIIMNERFSQYTASSGISFNSYWENTYHLIFEARFFIDEALGEKLSEPVRHRIEELEYQLQYAELMINLYDNIISFLTHTKEEQYIKDEAVLRLRENKEKLNAYQIHSPVFGVNNGLEASGVSELIDDIIALNQSNTSLANSQQ